MYKRQPEVYLWDGGQLEQLTDFNGAVLEGVTISVPERLTFTNTDGVDIDCLLYTSRCV